jgi:hypothetical protein
MRHHNQDVQASRAASTVLPLFYNDERAQADFCNYLATVEYVDELPQPYRSLMEREIEFNMTGIMPPAVPVTSFAPSRHEVGKLYKDEAAAKGITPPQVARAAQVPLAMVTRFFNASQMTAAVANRIEDALKKLGVRIGF